MAKEICRAFRPRARDVRGLCVKLTTSASARWRGARSSIRDSTDRCGHVWGEECLDRFAL